MNNFPIQTNHFTPSETKLDRRSKDLRGLILSILEYSRHGHLAPAFSLIELLRVLYDDILRFEIKNDRWKERDRLILSKGHGCLALYAILADKGFFPKEELKRFCKIDGILGGHPEYSKIPGVEASTGSLGHGLSIGVGFAINARFEKLSAKTFVIIGDGESNEGSVWEAAMCASKHKLDNLVVLIDYNKYQSYGTTFEVQDLEPFAAKWNSFGFEVVEIDGHDIQQLRKCLTQLPKKLGKPTAIICHTIKGKGILQCEGNLTWHHKNKLTDDDLRILRLELEKY